MISAVAFAFLALFFTSTDGRCCRVVVTVYGVRNVVSLFPGTTTLTAPTIKYVIVNGIRILRGRSHRGCGTNTRCFFRTRFRFFLAPFLVALFFTHFTIIIIRGRYL